MMRGQASDNILTLMASIDRLHSQATDSDYGKPRIRTGLASHRNLPKTRL